MWHSPNKWVMSSEVGFANFVLMSNDPLSSRPSLLVWIFLGKSISFSSPSSRQSVPSLATLLLATLQSNTISKISAALRSWAFLLEYRDKNLCSTRMRTCTLANSDWVFNLSEASRSIFNIAEARSAFTESCSTASVSRLCSQLRRWLQESSNDETREIFCLLVFSLKIFCYLANSYRFFFSIDQNHSNKKKKKINIATSGPQMCRTIETQTPNVRLISSTSSVAT